MDLHSEPGDKLVVTSSSFFFDWLLLLGAALCTVPTIRGALHGSFNLHESTPLIGTAFFLLGLLVTFERSRFEFDPALSCVRWSHTRTFARESGTIPFTRVQSVILQTSLGSSAVNPSYRVALITDRGELPLTTAYMAGFSKEYEAIASRIRTVLSMSPSASDIVLDSVRASLDRGRRLDAVHLLRHHNGLSLNEAVRFVKQLQRPPQSTPSPRG
jgi:hypothetical protein